jgi:hypothetical protein
MYWISENWFWVIFLILFIVLHMFGHGMHGGHRHGEQKEKGKPEENEHRHH